MAIKVTKEDGSTASLVAGVTMEGYSKPTATSAVAETDTMNGAIGKLEKALDGKAGSSHSHGNITNAGAIGTTADKLIATTTDGKLTASTSLSANSLSAGSTPTVSLSNGVLTFGIPKGDKGDTGSTGATGATGPKGDTGATGVSMRNKGNWASGTAYVNNTSYIDIVYYANNGCSYMCKTSHTASSSILPTNTTYWTLVASKGDKGDTGDKGDKGDTGTTGPQGVSISKVEQTTTSTADSGTNVITVTLSDGTKPTSL